MTANFAEVTTPTAPAAGRGIIFVSSTLNPIGPAYEDSTGTVRRLTTPSVKLTADGGNLTTATLADVVGLVFPVLNAVYYRFSFHLIYTTTVTTSGFKFGLTTPTTTHFSALGRTMSAADGVAGEFQGLVNSSADSVVATDAQAITADQLAIIEGTILPSANGNLQVQAANEGAAGTVVVKQGSNGLLWLLT